VKHPFRNSMKDVQTLPGAVTDPDHNLLVAKICTKLKKKEYLEIECDKLNEFQRTGHYVLMYTKMKELDCTLWKTHLGRGNGPVVRQTAE